MGCLFCDIINGSIPSKKVYEDGKVFAFDDINPQAPVHVLIVPKEHFKDIQDVSGEKSAVMSDVFKAVDKVAELKGIRDKGYRVIINNGTAGGQVIWHIHLHVMGGPDDLGPMLSL
jgi:histidine triad (HIT) family protein